MKSAQLSEKFYDELRNDCIGGSQGLWSQDLFIPPKAPESFC